ncbi:glucose-6-phosphate isomerase, partial [Schleiferiaceae bacterium]|nr:glucose-6-phosphate isomerase [Schleiferiaceae bacterium]
MHSINPTTTKSWKALLKHSETNNGLHLRELLYEKSRFKSMHIRIDDLLLFDYSKHRIDEITLSLLEDLFDECQVQKSLEEQFEGVKINVTENRPVLHTVLR